MQRQRFSLDNSIIVAIETMKKAVRESLLLDEDEDLRWFQANIDAEPTGLSEGSNYIQNRRITIDAVVEHPEQNSGWVSFQGECEVSELNGVWEPRSVNLWWVGTDWKRSCIFHPRKEGEEVGCLEIRAGAMPLIFAPTNL